MASSSSAKPWNNHYSNDLSNLYVCIKSANGPSKFDKKKKQDEERFLLLVLTENGNKTNLSLFLTGQQWADLRARLCFMRDEPELKDEPFLKNNFGERQEFTILRIAVQPSGDWVTTIIHTKYAAPEKEDDKQTAGAASNKPAPKFNTSDFVTTQSKPKYKFNPAAISIDATTLEELLADSDLKRFADGYHVETATNV